MKSTLSRRPLFRLVHLLLAGMLVLAGPAFGRERRRIPPPPPPQKVLRDIRNFFHRVGTGVKDASKQTWSAIRDSFEEDEPTRPPSTNTRPKGRTQSADPGTPGDSFARSKEAVPYRYDDAEDFDARRGTESGIRGEALPQVKITNRERTKNESAVSPAREVKPGKPNVAPDSNPVLSPEESASPPKTTAPSAGETIPFARPVPGKPGIVYLPGAKDSKESMVDVTGYQPGQVVRDPRSGKMFRVP